jgi:hypothetical protein
VSDDRANLCPCKDYAPSAEPGRGNEPALEAIRVEASNKDARQAPEGVSLESPDQIAARCVPETPEARLWRIANVESPHVRRLLAAEIREAERRGAAKALRGLAEYAKARAAFQSEYDCAPYIKSAFQEIAAKALRRAEEQEKA